MKIVVVGAGYVGLANAVLLAQHHDVAVVDLVAEKVDALNRGQSPIMDPDIDLHLRNRNLRLSATTDAARAYEGAEWVLIATSTDYRPQTHTFDTRSVDAVIADVMACAPQAQIVIRSTVPVGYTAATIKRTGCTKLMFAPEFLREGRALHDCLHPTRIVVGERSARGETFAGLLQEGARDRGVPALLVNSTEAEAIKLFANTYLAMRVAFFNELDTYAVTHGLDARQIIEGVCLDPRIGSGYNNPSFGYGGYCLPKDTKQLLSSCSEMPQDIIRAVVTANETRMDFIAEEVLRCKPTRIGIHRLIMKTGSDNFRSSSVLGVLRRLQAQRLPMLIYEPAYAMRAFEGIPVEADLRAFKARSDLILANRMSSDLEDVRAKVLSRDIFGAD